MDLNLIKLEIDYNWECNKDIMDLIVDYIENEKFNLLEITFILVTRNQWMKKEFIKKFSCLKNITNMDKFFKDGICLYFEKFSFDESKFVKINCNVEIIYKAFNVLYNSEQNIFNFLMKVLLNALDFLIKEHYSQEDLEIKFEFLWENKNIIDFFLEATYITDR